jgi:hypothetical protein
MMVLLEVLLLFGPTHPVVAIVSGRFMNGCTALFVLCKQQLLQQPLRLQHLLQTLLQLLPPYWQQTQDTFGSSNLVLQSGATLSEHFTTTWLNYGILLMRVVMAGESLEADLLLLLLLSD